MYEIYGIDGERERPWSSSENLTLAVPPANVWNQASIILRHRSAHPHMASSETTTTAEGGRERERGGREKIRIKDELGMGAWAR